MLTVIIPAYNEERSLSAVLQRVLALEPRPQVIVVDDGSRDDTAKIIRRFERTGQIRAVYCPVNRGKGAAIRAGLEYATEPWTIIQDADLEYYPEDYELLLAPIRAGRATVVFGSRNLHHEQAARKEFHYLRFWLGGKIVTLAANLLFGAHLTDEATCYKVFPTELLRKMSLRCRGFEFCPEVTAKTLRLAYRIHEVPIRYSPRSLAQGKKIRASDGLWAIWTLLKYRLATMAYLTSPAPAMTFRRKPAALAESRGQRAPGLPLPT